jgi:hypothetical protein
VQHAFQKTAYDPVRRVFITGLSSGMWIYSVQTRQWTRLTSSLPHTSGFTMLMIYDPDVQAALWFPNQEPANFVHAFDHATNSWVVHDTFPSALRHSYLFSAHDSHRRMHLITQLGLSNSTRSMWLYDALARQWTEITNVPSALTEVHSVAYDSINRVFVVIQPGSNGALDLWAYDAVGQWSALTPAGTRPTGTDISSRWNTLSFDPAAQVFFFVNVKAGRIGSGTDRAEEGAVEMWLYRYRR